MMTITNALVLARSAYRDNDRMLTLLSPELGRVDAVARGCRKPKSPLIGAAECFTAGEYGLIATGGRYAVAQCQITESFYPLRSELDRLTCGAYVLHLAREAAVPGEPCERLFLTTLRALAFLAYGALPLPLVVMAYELHYLALRGESPMVGACVRCGKPLTDEATRFSVSLGGVCCPACPGDGRPLSHEARRILLRVPQTRFDVIDRLIDKPAWREAALCSRRFIRARLETPPKSWPPLPSPDEACQT